MRTSVDLPDDVLERIRDIAADRRISVSKVIAELVSAAVHPTVPTQGPTGAYRPVDRAVPPGPPGRQRVHIDPLTGLKVLELGRTVTADELREAMGD